LCHANARTFFHAIASYPASEALARLLRKEPFVISSPPFLSSPKISVDLIHYFALERCSVNKVPAVVVWAIAFAYVEAAVVVYLRALYYPLDSGGFRFPILTFAQLQEMGTEHVRRLAIELGRELSTLVMLAAVGLTAGKNRREAWAHFMVAFGVWDLFYYMWLKVFLGWPESLMTWDLLFLIPVPWVGPVVAPMIVSVALIISGVLVLYRELAGQPLRAGWLDWSIISAGGVVVILAFCWDYANIMNGGSPSPFHWSLFSLGLATSTAAFARILLLSSNCSEAH
jgi:hypothetical protein